MDVCPKSRSWNATTHPGVGSVGVDNANADYASSASHFFRLYADILMLFATQRQSLHNSRIGFAALSEFLQGKSIVVILVHLIEYFIDSLLRRILVLRWLLTLKITNSILDGCISLFGRGCADVA